MNEHVSLRDLSYQYPIIIFDGVCHLCDHTVTFILDHDKEEQFRFCTLQHYQQNRLLPHVVANSVVLMHNGQIFSHSEAVMKILLLLGGKFRWVGMSMKLFPSFLRNTVYNIIARYRYRWFGKYEVCRLPDADSAHRFIGS
ncbi:MAG: DUF393 domain-containing protein [Saprospiraceae bacterium]|nr:DUF393 domain-containing protein [Saprospiraceae bacterium]MBL0098740.1 DUF393 domain-containing protein [Saprospiraceae bacterium]